MFLWSSRTGILTGGHRRYQACRFTSPRLSHKQLLVCTVPVAEFGCQFQLLACEPFGPSCQVSWQVLLSDGDPALGHYANTSPLTAAGCWTRGLWPELCAPSPAQTTRKATA